MEQQWYETWFDKEYYHLLYQDRDLKEAAQFIENLLNHLKPAKDARFLDIGCGKGRHAIQIHKRGFEVVGYDLSGNSIAEAKKSETKGLNFYQHDMRNLFRINYFDFALNIFTSFGYFSAIRDEQKAIHSMVSSVKKGGHIVFDFLNKEQVINELVPEEEKTVGNITFKISKKIADGHVVKSIRFTTNGKTHEYVEKVKLLSLEDFTKHFDREGIKITSTFGSYQLESYKANSKRLIIIGEKL